MALVFVHGIGSRSMSASYQEDVALRDALFRRFLVRQAMPELASAPIHNPMWGDLGARMRWMHSSLPRGGRERFGSADPGAEDLHALFAATDPARPVARLASADLRDAVDLLYTLADLRGRSAAEIEDLADLAGAFVDYCDAQAVAPPWLANVANDEDLLDRLRQASAPRPQASTTEQFGGTRQVGRHARDILAAGMRRYRTQTIGPSARLAAIALRRLAAEPVSLLIGDVFCYLDTRGTLDDPGEIVQVVTAALDHARADGPLVVVAHSMGGNIVYDILSYFRPDLEVDVLVTVGSQVGLFEELTLFRASDPTIPNAAMARVPAPSNIRRWINVVDPADVLGYRIDPIFAGAVDYDYPSKEPWAHTAYFRQPYFHQRLAMQVREALT